MTDREIVEFALINRNEGYINGLLSARAFMSGWIRNSPVLNEEQKFHLQRGLDNMLSSCAEQEMQPQPIESICKKCGQEYIPFADCPCGGE